MGDQTEFFDILTSLELVPRLGLGTESRGSASLCHPRQSLSIGIPRQSLGTSKSRLTDQKLHEQKAPKKAQSQQPRRYPYTFTNIHIRL